MSDSLFLVIPALLGLVVWGMTMNISAGIAVFSILIMPKVIQVYSTYVQDNPKQLWFKRKLYGWGWTPVTWQGWLVTLIYVGALAAFSQTIDETSPPQEVAFTFGLPAVLLTLAFIRIAYKKGETPRWQWGHVKK